VSRVYPPWPEAVKHNKLSTTENCTFVQYPPVERDSQASQKTPRDFVPNGASSHEPSPATTGQPLAAPCGHRGHGCTMSPVITAMRHHACTAYAQGHACTGYAHVLHASKVSYMRDKWTVVRMAWVRYWYSTYNHGVMPCVRAAYGPCRCAIRACPYSHVYARACLPPSVTPQR
jgi:hypothetical protein